MTCDRDVQCEPFSQTKQSNDYLYNYEDDVVTFLEWLEDINSKLESPLEYRRSLALKIITKPPEHFGELLKLQSPD